MWKTLNMHLNKIHKKGVMHFAVLSLVTKPRMAMGCSTMKYMYYIIWHENINTIWHQNRSENVQSIVVLKKNLRKKWIFLYNIHSSWLIVINIQSSLNNVITLAQCTIHYLTISIIFKRVNWLNKSRYCRDIFMNTIMLLLRRILEKLVCRFARKSVCPSVVWVQCAQSICIDEVELFLSLKWYEAKQKENCNNNNNDQQQQHQQKQKQRNSSSHCENPFNLSVISVHIHISHAKPSNLVQSFIRRDRWF